MLKRQGSPAATILANGLHRHDPYHPFGPRVDLDSALPDPGADEQGEVTCSACGGSGTERGPTPADDDECMRCEGLGTVTGPVER